MADNFYGDLTHLDGSTRKKAERILNDISRVLIAFLLHRGISPDSNVSLIHSVFFWPSAWDPVKVIPAPEFNSMFISLSHLFSPEINIKPYLPFYSYWQ